MKAVGRKLPRREEVPSRKIFWQGRLIPYAINVALDMRLNFSYKQNMRFCVFESEKKTAAE
jgi:hypothetical protein